MSVRARFVASLIGVALSVPASAQQAVEVEATSGVTQNDVSSTIDPMRFKDDSHDRMTVPVTLAGAGPFNFLVDTGADRTAISREVVKRLGLERAPRATLHSITGATAVDMATIRALGLSRKTMGLIDAPVLEGVNIGADGVLGTDVLRSQTVQFDFRHNLLSLGSAKRDLPRDPPGTIVVEASRRAGRLIVTRAIADGQALTVVLDTGSEVTIGNAALRRALARHGALRSPRPIQLQSVTGAVISGEMIQLRSLEIGGITLEGLAIVFADAHTFEQMRLEERPTLLLGMNALRAFDLVTIDFVDRKFRVVLPRGGQRVAARD